MKLQSIQQIQDIHFCDADTLVIFGEVFDRGYVNGLIQVAQKKGMKIIYSTVGRRSPDGKLNKLNSEELSTQPTNFINVPLEAGFDMEPSHTGVSPVHLCQNIPLTKWATASLDKDLINDSKNRSIMGFKNRTLQWLKQLSDKLPQKGNVLIVHTMAGGVPRAKILLPALNRILKGVGKRFFSSKTFWDSDLGWLCKTNFNEVTAQTYKHLIELSTPLREQLNKQGREIFYTSYSYHGTKVLIKDQYQWQSYAPYLQGFAKQELEKISQYYFQQKIQTCVFNVPEILTKSSAIFPGVEIPLYTILAALKKEGGSQASQIIQNCLKKMTDNAFDIIQNTTNDYFESEEIKQQSVFAKWPQHNQIKHMEKMISTSKLLSHLHKDLSQSITPYLSQILFTSCAHLILQEINPNTQPVCWIGHDIIATDIKERY